MDEDATNHLIYRVERRKFISDHLLQNEFNGMAHLGWQLHSITAMADELLIVYSGIRDDKPTLKYWETESGF